MYLGEGAYGVEAAVAHLLRQVREGPERSTKPRRIAGILQTWRNAPTVEHGARQAAPVLRAAADGRQGLHHAEGGRRRQGAADRAAASTDAAADSVAPYFLEEVRKELEGRYGAKALYENGLTVQTALDLQAAGRGATARSTRACGASITSTGFRKPRRNVARRKAHARRIQAPALGPPVRASATSSRRS